MISEEYVQKFARELLAELEGEVQDSLRKLFEIDKKSELEKYCRDLILTKEDFAGLVYNCGRIGYLHDIKSQDFVPKHLAPSDDEVASLSSVKVGQELPDKAKKFARKLSQIFKDRRFLVAHIFYNQQKWHIFFFDQRDMEDKAPNHWKEGPHVHFVNHLWPEYDPTDLWEVFNRSNASVGGKLHIRFLDPG